MARQPRPSARVRWRSMLPARQACSRSGCSLRSRPAEPAIKRIRRAAPGGRAGALAMVVAVSLLGCGARCPEIAATQRALIERTAIAPGPHVQVRIPLARANAFIAEL